MQSIPFIDLRSQQLRIAPRLAALTAEVLERCDFIGGTFISRLETALAERAGVIQCIACASGTDALILALMALGMKPGERVICPSYTFAATVEAVALLHGIPVFVDVDPDTRNLDPVALRVLLEAEPGTFRGIIAVDIFGQPANYAAINELADTHGLWVIADAAQSFGARSALGQVGSLATITTTSFYPAKPLGCYGDGGALFTADEALAQRLRSLRNHGQSQQRYLYDAVGLCSRLDTWQAAVLLAKLEVFDDELRERQRIANRYTSGLAASYSAPALTMGSTSTWAQYTVSLRATPDEDLKTLAHRRDSLVAALHGHGVPTQVYYAPAMHLQAPYAGYPRGTLHATELLSAATFSLPMHAYLDDDAVDTILRYLNEVRDVSKPRI